MRFAASVLAVTLMSLGLLAPQPSRAQTPGVYITAGDSIAAGIGASLPREHGNGALVHGWLEALTGATVPFENLAIPGETAASFIDGGQLQRLRETVTRANEAQLPILAVTISLGGNELLGLEANGLADRKAGLDDFRQRYNEAVAAIRTAVGDETPIVVLTYYNLTGGDSTIQLSDAWWIEQFNDVIRSVAQTHNAGVADLPDRFTGRIDELTHYPFDVHPSNTGHAEIARAVWSTLALDTEPPIITIDSDLEVTRSTPTVRFTVADNVGVRSVTAQSDGVAFHGPFETAPNEYAMLLDVEVGEATEVALTLEISDDAGNVTIESVSVRFADVGEGETQ
jgi:lysophospholipase L1-like esterase